MMKLIKVSILIYLLFLEYDHIVMICDPPRSGLHKEIVYSCRKCSAITELIYVSCNPTGSFIENTRMFLLLFFIR